MAEEPKHVVVRQQGKPDRPYQHNALAKDVLLGVTGVKAGALKDTSSGVEFAGSSQVPAGVYQLVMPAAPPVYDPEEMHKDLQSIAAEMDRYCRVMQPKQTWLHRLFHGVGQEQAKKAR